MPFRHATSRALKQPSFWRLLIHLPKLFRLTWRLLKDGRTPVIGKLVFLLAVGYLFWPLDLIPDFLFPVVGHLDDLAVLLAGLRYLLKQTPPQLLEEHLAQIE